MPYLTDLAFVHDDGYGEFARRSAPWLLAQLDEAGLRPGPVVDWGCGSGIWAAELSAAGYQVLGVDLSPAMIELACRRAPRAEFHVGSLYDFALPACRAVTALGEVLNYALDECDMQPRLRGACQRAMDALAPGGLLIFDLAEPGRSADCRQAFRETDDWTCLVEYDHDAARARLSRRIVTFRRDGHAWRRSEETHVQQLFDPASVAAMLGEMGFQVETMRSYGQYALADHTVAFVARKPRGGAAGSSLNENFAHVE
jgi:SAM-dependent methyltransferase